MKRIITILAAGVFLLCALAVCGCTAKAQVPDKVVTTADGAKAAASASAASSTSASDSASSEQNDDATASAGNAAGGTVVAFLSDNGAADGSDYNKQIWQGVQKFASGDSKYSAKSYDIADAADEAAHSALVAKAIGDGAGVVVLPGATYANVAATVAKDNPSVQFLLVDAMAGLQDANAQTAPSFPTNVHAISFDNFQAGYLAGYALVHEGYKGLGFAGGTKVATVQAFGSGFVQGANAAATQMDVAADTYLAYWYTGTYAPSDAVQTEVARWYSNGVDCVISCGGGISGNVVAAAAGAGKTCAMADFDGSGLGSSVVCSATLSLAKSTQEALTALGKNGGTWASDYAGTVSRMDVSNDGVALTCGSSWTLKQFSQGDYNTLVSQMKSGQVAVNESLDATIDTAIQLDMK